MRLILLLAMLLPFQIIAAEQRDTQAPPSNESNTQQQNVPILPMPPINTTEPLQNSSKSTTEASTQPSKDVQQNTTSE